MLASLPLVLQTNLSFLSSQSTETTQAGFLYKCDTQVSQTMINHNLKFLNIGTISIYLAGITPTPHMYAHTCTAKAVCMIFHNAK